MSTISLRLSLIAIYNSFIRPQLDNGDIIYDEANNSKFHLKLGSVLCNATRAKRCLGVCKEKFYQEYIYTLSKLFLYSLS